MSLQEKLSECSILVKPVLTRIPLLLVSLGEHGMLYCSASDLPLLSLELPCPFIMESPLERVRCLHYPAAAVNGDGSSSVLSVSGAGDRLVTVCMSCACQIEREGGGGAGELCVFSCFAVLWAVYWQGSALGSL